jgi:intergrase/recombinase
VTNVERELKNHAVNKDRNKQILSRWRRLNHDRGAGLQARTERQHRINPQTENLEQRQVGSGGIENRVTDGKIKPEKRKQINREVRKSQGSEKINRAFRLMAKKKITGK